jgi:hypothetical protein
LKVQEELVCLSEVHRDAKDAKGVVKVVPLSMAFMSSLAKLSEF